MCVVKPALHGVIPVMDLYSSALEGFQTGAWINELLMVIFACTSFLCCGKQDLNGVSILFDYYSSLAHIYIPVDGNEVSLIYNKTK